MNPLNQPPPDAFAVGSAVRGDASWSLPSDVFSGGRRWFAGRFAGISWSIAWSLPLSAAGVVAVGVVENSLAAPWLGWLAALWITGLVFQALIAAVLWRFWLGRRKASAGSPRGLPVDPTSGGVSGGVLSKDEPLVSKAPAFNTSVPSTSMPSTSAANNSAANNSAANAMVPKAMVPNSLDLTITVGGTWLLPRPVFAVLPLWGCTLLSLVGISATAAALAEPQQIQTGWTLAVMPSLGSASVDRLPAAAAWIWCLQAVWQTLPIPGSLGRVGWSAVVHVLSGGKSSCRVMRLAVNASAIVMLLSALMAVRSGESGAFGYRAPESSRPAGNSATSGQQEFGQRGDDWTRQAAEGPGDLGLPSQASWTTVLALATLSAWMFASSRGSDLPALQHQLDRTAPTTPLGSEPSWLSSWRTATNWRGWKANWRGWRRQRQNRKRLLAAVARERGEARDVQEAEQVLRKLHEHGMASLSRQERDLLQRVSETVRRQRQSTSCDTD